MGGYHNITKMLKVCISHPHVEIAYFGGFFDRMCKKNVFLHVDEPSYPHFIHKLGIMLRKLMSYPQGRCGLGIVFGGLKVDSAFKL